MLLKWIEFLFEMLNWRPNRSTEAYGWNGGETGDNGSGLTIYKPSSFML